MAKFQNRVHVYAVEGGFPVFFDVDGRGSDIFPTGFLSLLLLRIANSNDKLKLHSELFDAVYALWIVPELLPAFVLKGGEVSRFVIGGADLMFPGITVPPEGLPSFRAGEPWAVKVPGNPAPIAVCNMHCFISSLSLISYFQLIRNQSCCLLRLLLQHVLCVDDTEPLYSIGLRVNLTFIDSLKGWEYHHEQR